MSETRDLNHWADMTADRLIKQNNDKEQFVLASGITPSGVVHFGNFREVITVDLVVRALRDRGKKVRFIFSWDDYDTFRKVPANMPNPEMLETYLFQPIVDTPDPFGQAPSYAAHHEQKFEAQLVKVGIEVEPLYQAKKYRAGEYAQSIIHALKKAPEIRAILNKHRTEPLAESWLPVSIYCPVHKTDRVEITGFDGVSKISYRHLDHDLEGEVDILTSPNVKLPWRIDWPMRWAFEKVDFEPGGKDHSSQGGSFSTAKEIVELFDWKAPVYIQYDFVSIRGAGGKMSSSKGNVVTVNDVLDIYEPEMVRWIFASYKTNIDFAISFDLDVIKTYEDFDRQERLAFGLETGNEKKVAVAKRVYELSQIEKKPEQMPFQPSFRHLCNILQINDGDREKARAFYQQEMKNERDTRRFEQRSKCALFWLENYAPEEFKFQMRSDKPDLIFTKEEKTFLASLVELFSTKETQEMSDKQLHEKMYQLIHAATIEPTTAFRHLYQILIGKDQGPKLAGFILSIGIDRVKERLELSLI
jgi:lysyl-tRNA synthetase, class I